MTTWQLENDENRAEYDRLASEHGGGYCAADWGSRESQELRFRILEEVGIAPDDSVLDVGCGVGDFYGWLRARGYRDGYIGIDLSPKAIAIAKRKYGDVRFFVGDVLDELLPAADFVVASGVFAKRPRSGQAYLEATVQRMFDRCETGVAFNGLSKWAPNRQENEFHSDPLETLNFCRALTPWTVLRADYHARDFTIYLYKERRV